MQTKKFYPVLDEVDKTILVASNNLGNSVESIKKNLRGKEYFYTSIFLVMAFILLHGTLFFLDVFDIFYAHHVMSISLFLYLSLSSLIVLSIKSKYVNIKRKDLILFTIIFPFILFVLFQILSIFMFENNIYNINIATLSYVFYLIIVDIQKQAYISNKIDEVLDNKTNIPNDIVDIMYERIERNINIERKYNLSIEEIDTLRAYYNKIVYPSLNDDKIGFLNPSIKR